MKEIVCHNSNCGCSTRVRAATLEQIFQCLEEINGNVRWLNYLCPECKHLQFARVLEGKTQWSDPDQNEHHAGKSVSLLRLECAQKCHLSPIAVIRPMNDDTYYDRVFDDMNEWTLLDAKCPKGHPPTKPWEISTARKSMSFV